MLTYGVGGLGHQAVQLAKSFGATVFAVDFKPEARNLAGTYIPPEQVFDIQDLQIAVDNADKPFTVDIVIDFVANKQSKCLSSVQNMFVAAIHIQALNSRRRPCDWTWPISRDWGASSSW